MKNAKEEAEK